MQDHGIKRDAVLLRTDIKLQSAEEESFAKALATFGFSDIVRDDGHVSSYINVISADTLIAHPGISSSLQSLADGNSPNADDLWASHETANPTNQYTSLDLAKSNMNGQGAVAIMVQMSLPHVPIVSFNQLPQNLPRDQAHYVRSLIFWRNRNGIAGMTPRLVHAGTDGTLVYILGSWMVAMNWNNDEISIDIGDTGSMWLMLGTPRDVQLQGSLLVLPAYSGAILANELAR